MARPRHRPTTKNRRMVEGLSGRGVSQDSIADFIGIAGGTLTKHYRRALDVGRIKATANVAQNLFRIATRSGPGAVTAATFWLRCKGGPEWQSPEAGGLGGSVQLVISG